VDVVWFAFLQVPIVYLLNPPNCSNVTPKGSPDPLFQIFKPSLEVGGELGLLIVTMMRYYCIKTITASKKAHWPWGEYFGGRSKLISL